MASIPNIAYNKAPCTNIYIISDFDAWNGACMIIEKRTLTDDNMSIYCAAAKQCAIISNHRIMSDKILRENSHIVPNCNINSNSRIRVNNASLTDFAETTYVGIRMYKRWRPLF